MVNIILKLEYKWSNCKKSIGINQRHSSNQGSYMVGGESMIGGVVDPYAHYEETLDSAYYNS